ncbi:MAG: hypothetical protein ACK559_41380, partial [bacterium]
HQGRSQPFRQERITEGGRISRHQHASPIEGRVPIPDPKTGGAPFAGVRRQPQGGEEPAQHGLGIEILSTQEGAHPNAVALLAWEHPTKSLGNQAEVETRHSRLHHLTGHLQREGGGIAGAGGAQSEAARQGGAGSVGDQQAAGLQG